MDAEDEDLMPMVFLCAGCRRPVGDTLSWVANDEETGCILLRSESRSSPSGLASVDGEARSPAAAPGGAAGVPTDALPLREPGGSPRRPCGKAQWAGVPVSRVGGPAGSGHLFRVVLCKVLMLSLAEVGRPEWERWLKDECS
uniref:Protein yippee-like n=1 Tax=Athene cunicularia TaxID=194338 RepID=A0A663N9K6_ATHCN